MESKDVCGAPGELEGSTPGRSLLTEVPVRRGGQID